MSYKDDFRCVKQIIEANQGKVISNESISE